MPVRKSVAWVPVDSPVADPVQTQHPVFVSDQALADLQSIDPSGDPGVIGALLGELRECSSTGVRYIVIRAAEVLMRPFEGDRPLPVIARTLVPLQKRLGGGTSRVLGWYHTHTVHGVSLSLADIETHARVFKEPWQLALVIAGQEGGPTGFFYRPATTKSAEPIVPLPFYELREGIPEEAESSARRQRARWSGYRSTEATFQPPAPRSSQAMATPGALNPPIRPSRGSGSILIPVTGYDPDDPAWSHRRRWRWLPRAKRYAAIAVLVAGLVLGFGAVRNRLGTPAPDTSPEPVVAPVSPELERAAGDLQRAIAAYNEKVRLFDSRMMVCSDLAGGLVAVEDRIVAFSALRRASAGTADSAGASRFQALFEGADSVESHFERSGCARP